MATPVRRPIPSPRRFPMEGRDLESICRAAVRRIDECLAEAAEVINPALADWAS